LSITLLRWIAIALLLLRRRVAVLWRVALLRVALLRRIPLLRGPLLRVALLRVALLRVALLRVALLRRVLAVSLLRVASLLRIASHSGLLHATAPVYLAREHGTLGIPDIQADLTALGKDHRLIRL
jgi:hypothetical protein